MAGNQEIVDQSGTTEHFSGTATTSVTSITFPFWISDIQIVANNTNRLQISFDGTNFMPVEKAIGWSPKKKKQVWFKTSNSSTQYNGLVNLETY
jgi:hypothetical protein